MSPMAIIARLKRAQKRGDVCACGEPVMAVSVCMPCNTVLMFYCRECMHGNRDQVRAEHERDAEHRERNRLINTIPVNERGLLTGEPRSWWFE